MRSPHIIDRDIERLFEAIQRVQALKGQPKSGLRRIWGASTRRALSRLRHSRHAETALASLKDKVTQGQDAALAWTARCLIHLISGRRLLPHHEVPAALEASGASWNWAIQGAHESDTCVADLALFDACRGCEAVAPFHQLLQTTEWPPHAAMLAEWILGGHRIGACGTDFTALFQECVARLDFDTIPVPGTSVRLQSQLRSQFHEAATRKPAGTIADAVIQLADDSLAQQLIDRLLVSGDVEQTVPALVQLAEAEHSQARSALLRLAHQMTDNESRSLRARAQGAALQPIRNSPAR